MLGLEVFEQFQPALSGQCDIQQDQVRRGLFDNLHRLLGILRFAADHHIGIAIDGAAQTLPHQGMILNNEDSLPRCTFGRQGYLGRHINPYLSAWGFYLIEPPSKQPRFRGRYFFGSPVTRRLFRRDIA